MNFKKRLKLAFEIPSPTGKEEFLKNFEYPKTSSFDFIKDQASYIRKRVWIFSILFFLNILYAFQYFQTLNNVVIAVSTILPFLSLITILEITRSTSYNMVELEMSCKHSNSKVILARLVVLGSFNFVFLFVIILLFFFKTDYGYLSLVFNFLTPFLLTSCSTLLIINHLQTRETPYVCAGITTIVSVINLFFNAQITELFAFKYLMFFILIIATVVQINKLIKRTEDLECNLLSTV